MKVETVMTKDVITLSAEDSVLEASMKLSQRKISGAPVVDSEGKLTGLLSEADILGALKTYEKTLHLVYPSLSSISVSFREQIKEKEASDAYRELETVKVGDIMTTDVETTRPDEELRAAIKRMIAKGVNRLPVVDRSGKVIGIITRGDILHGIAENNNNNSANTPPVTTSQ